MLSALGGYVLGTLQVLLVDWFQRRREHARQLRLIRADLRNASTFDRKFEWKDGVPPADDLLPRPPEVSPNFQATLAATDFTLTDEHENDNSQEGLLGITSGFDTLAHYHRKFLEVTDRVKIEEDRSKKRSLYEEAVGYTSAYDSALDRLLYLLDDSIRDLDRRLRAASIWWQLNRPLEGLPVGVNPPPLVDNDPRVRAFAERKKLKRPPHDA